MTQDVTQDVTQNVTQDVAEGVSGAAEDGSVKVFVVALWHASPSNAPSAFLRRHVKDEHAKDAAQGVAEGVP